MAMRTEGAARLPRASMEPVDVRWMRQLVQRWPLPHGKGVLMRALSPLLRRRPFLFSVEPGVLIPGALDDYMVLWTFTNTYLDDGPVRLSRALLREGDRVLDIGAHIGLWVMGAARKVGQTGVVRAVEPSPDNYQRLVANLRLNGLDRVVTTQAAMSDRAGTASLFQPTYNHSGHPSMARHEGLCDSVTVEATTLDEYCQRSGLDGLDFIKVDVEGAEMLVFRGGERLLSSDRAPAILFEVNEDTAASFGFKCSDGKGFLRDRGYSIFRYDGVELRAVEIERVEAPGDCFALKPHHIERLPAALRRVAAPRSTSHTGELAATPRAGNG